VQIVIFLDSKGNFKDAKLEKKALIFPATENSAARTSGWNAHPLADQIKYCAGDYKDYIDDAQNDNSYFSEDTLSEKDRKNLVQEKNKGEEKFTYFELLTRWVESEYTHPMAKAVWNYVRKGCLVKDLVRKEILAVGDNGKLLHWNSNYSDLPVMKMMKDNNLSLQGNLVVIWDVVTEGEKDHQTWESQSLQESWALFYASLLKEKGLCMISGDSEALLANKHPNGIRRPGDSAKLISSNNESKGFFTFSGKFTNPQDACSISYEVTAKAHNALKWLIDRQGFRNNDQVVLAWSVKGVQIPNPMEDFSPDDFQEIDVDSDDFISTAELPIANTDSDVNLGQDFSLKLKKALLGYEANLESSDTIAIIALDSATTGRLSITFYREKEWSDYQNRLLSWQEDLSWPIYRRSIQSNRRFWKKTAPTPKEIAKAAYGDNANEKLIKQTVERLLPCIADGSPIPLDLVNSCVRRACFRPAYEDWEWKEILGIACALYKGYYARLPIKEKRRKYNMGLDETNVSRDYLYGRLLAVAERIEFIALNISNENRPTNAERMMQRFSDAPFATWALLEKAIQPYRLRLKGNREGFVQNMDRLLDSIMSSFKTEEFTSSARLSGEFLLGYHSQRNAFRKNKEDEDNID